MLKGMELALECSCIDNSTAFESESYIEFKLTTRSTPFIQSGGRVGDKVVCFGSLGGL